MNINVKLLAYYRSRSHVITADERYNNSYGFVLLRTGDLAAAAVVWREYGVTISAFTGLELRAAAPATWAIYLGAFLVFCQNNHCEQAIAADRERAVTAQGMLK